MNKKKTIKICLVSSSGGHFEQLKMLQPLGEKYDTYIVTEKTEYNTKADYYLLPPTKLKGKMRIIGGNIRFLGNFVVSLKHLMREKPDVIISTGTRAAIPTVFWAHILGKKVVYIETFARINDGTRAAKLVYKMHWADLFLYQWESLKEVYPEGVYGGGIY